MRVNITTDSGYPLAIDDSWGGISYIDDTTVEEDQHWNAFINALQKKREQVLNKKKKKALDNVGEC